MVYNFGMENKLKIGSIIKHKRLELNLRMDDVANRVGITRSTLWSIENGKGNYTIDVFLKLVNILGLSLTLESQENKNERKRATRVNTLLDKKINRFIIMCIEQYALKTNTDSKTTYNQLNKTGVIKELIDDYEDMHGMSTYSINEYISHRLQGGNV